MKNPKLPHPPKPDPDAPDPSNSYERSHPERESGMGRLDTDGDATPAESSDKIEESVKHRQRKRQLNTEDAVSKRGGTVEDNSEQADEEPG